MTVAAMRTTGFSEVFSSVPPANALRIPGCQHTYSEPPPGIAAHCRGPQGRFLYRQTGNSSRHPLPGIRIFLICALANSTEKWYYL